MIRKLKILILICIWMCLSVSTAHAQTHYHANISVGAKGGADISKVFFTPDVKQGLATGINFGVAARYIEENHFGIIVECNYMQRGWKEDFEELPFKYSRRLDYIQILFLAHIYFGRRGKFFVNLGPEVGFRIGSKITSNFDVDDIAHIPDFPSGSRIISQYYIENAHAVDYGITGGLGGEFSINRRNAIYIEGRFYYGLGNVFPNGRQDPFRGSNSMNISICAGYWFRVK